MTMAKKSLIRLAWKEAGLSEENLETLLEERYSRVSYILTHSTATNYSMSWKRQGRVERPRKERLLQRT